MKPMRHKSLKFLFLLLIIPLFLYQFRFTNVKAVDYYVVNDGDVFVYTGSQLETGELHTYIPQFNGRYKNVTAYPNVLTLSKGDYAYSISCYVNDNMTVKINKWFYGDVTQFQPIAEDESSLSFTLNTRDKGEPQAISGTSAWSYNENTTTISLTCPNNSPVTIRWESEGTKQVLWWFDRFDLWLGLGGLFFCMIAPIMAFLNAKDDDLQKAFLWIMGIIVLGIPLIIVGFWG